MFYIMLMFASLNALQSEQQIEQFPRDFSQAAFKIKSSLDAFKKISAQNSTESFLFYKELLGDFTKIYEDKRTLSLVTHNVSEGCTVQLSNLAFGLLKREMWAIQIIDAYGKPPAGILQGNLLWVGDYKECLNTTNEAIGWSSKYCSIQKGQPLDGQQLDATSFIKYGICMPQNCSHDDIVSILNLCNFYFPKKCNLKLCRFSNESSYFKF
jgi:hypothetical protein